MDSTPRISAHTLEYLKEIYFDATETIRHYDGLRASFTQTFASLLAIFTSVVSAAALQGMANTLVPAAAAVVSILSLLGLGVILKLNDLINLQRRRAREAMSVFQG